MVELVKAAVTNVSVPTTLPPVGASYQTSPGGVVPLMVAIRVAESPAQIVTAETERVSTGGKAWLASPFPPLVAPLGGNSVRPSELVVPFLPPLTICVTEPALSAIYPPPPPPPGPSASFLAPKYNAPDVSSWFPPLPPFALKISPVALNVLNNIVPPPPPPPAPSLPL